MPNEIYIVQGSTGEYSDRHEWIVVAFANEDVAMARVERLEALLREFGTDDADWDDRRRAEEIIRTHAEGDPQCSIDYTGTRYFLTKCTFIVAEIEEMR